MCNNKINRDIITSKGVTEQMEDKTFELIEKMYNEFNQRFDKVESGIQKVGNQIAKLELVVENEIKPDIKLALEGYHDVREILTRVEGKLDDLAEKVEYHDVEIAALKGR